MRPRTRRILTVAVIAVTGLAIAAFTGMQWLLRSEAGARFGFARLMLAVPGKLTAGRIQGKLNGGLKLLDVHYENQDLVFDADRVDFNWYAGALFRQTIRVRSLGVLNGRLRLVRNVRAGQPGQPLTKLPDIHFRFPLLVDQMRLDTLSVLLPTASAPLVASRIWIDGLALRDTLTARHLMLRSSTADLDLRFAVLPRGDYPLWSIMSWTARAPNAPPVTGQGRLDGSLSKLLVTQDLQGGVDGRLSATLTSLLKDPSIDGEIVLRDLALRRWNAGLPEARVKGRLLARGPLASLQGSGAVDVRTPQQLYRSEFGFAHRGPAWALENLRLTMPGRPGAVLANAQVEPTGGTVRFSARTSWQRIVLSAAGSRDTLVASPAGNARVWGTPTAYHAEGAARVTSRRLPVGSWRFAAHGGTNHVVVDALRGQVLGGSVNGRGTVAWGSPLRWTAAVEGRGLDPSTRWRKWPGKVDVSARTRGTVARGGPAGRVDVTRIAGTLRDRPLQGRAGVAFRGREMNLDSLSVAVGSAHVAAGGRLGAVSDLGWKVDAPRLGDLLPDADGTLLASGRVGGSREQPRLQAHAVGDSLALGLKSAVHLALDADLDLASGRPLTLSFSGQRLISGSTTGKAWVADSVRVTGSGTSSAHRLDAAMRHGTQQTAFALSGGLTGNTWLARTWAGRIETLALQSPQLGTWGLRAPAPLTISPMRSSLTDFCWTSGAAALCADARWDRRTGWDAHATLDSVRLALLSPLVPGSPDMTGNVAGHVTVSGGGARPLALDLLLEPGPGTLGYTGVDSARFDRGLVRATTVGRALHGEARLAFPDNGTIAGTLALPAFASGAPVQPIDGRLVIDLRSMSLLQAFTPQVDSVAGTMHADLRLLGTTAQPRPAGTARITNGSALVARYGVRLHDVNLTADGAGGRMRFDASAASGPGRVQVQGTADMLPGATPRLAAHVQGDRFLAYHPEKDQHLLVSPDVEVHLVGDSLSVTGQVTVPDARVELQDLRSSTRVTASPDVVYVNASDQTARPPIRIFSQVRMRLGDNVEVTGSGLDSHVTGDLMVMESPGLPARATGGVQLVKGTYEAYGQKLTIDRGRLYYSGGAIMNPGVDLRVSRTASDGTVAGFTVGGTLRESQLTIFSDPTMSEREALSYVLFGRPLEQTGPRENSMMTDAANQLGLAAGNWLTGTAAHQLGLAQASIETRGPLEQASLALGTYLSPRLFVQYGLGLFDNVSRLHVNYILSNKWTLNAEVADQNRASLLYRIEY